MVYFGGLLPLLLRNNKGKTSLGMFTSLIAIFGKYENGGLPEAKTVCTHSRWLRGHENVEFCNRIASRKLKKVSNPCYIVCSYEAQVEYFEQLNKGENLVTLSLSKKSVICCWSSKKLAFLYRNIFLTKTYPANRLSPNLTLSLVIICLIS